MNVPALRILDANLNRAREALRVLEEHVRLVSPDAALCLRLKQMRHTLAQIADLFGAEALLAARDIRGDIGTSISTDTEHHRDGPAHVARAAAKRLTESLRCIEEYGKIINVAAAARVEQLRYDAYALEQEILATLPRRAALCRARLHVLITESLCRRPWLEVCERALQGGADVLQLREKALADRDLLQRARQMRELTRRFDALLIINDRPDIARLAGADGVHLGEDDLSIAEARQIAGPTALIGRTVHSVAEAQEALAQGPDYLGVGPMFASRTKTVPTTSRKAEEPTGPAFLIAVAELLTNVKVSGEDIAALRDDDRQPTTELRPPKTTHVWHGPPAGVSTGETPVLQEPLSGALRKEEYVPLVAIGGITSENVATLLAEPTGTRRIQVAVCQSVIGADDPAAAAANLKKALGAETAKA